MIGSSIIKETRSALAPDDLICGKEGMLGFWYVFMFGRRALILGEVRGAVGFVGFFDLWKFHPTSWFLRCVAFLSDLYMPSFNCSHNSWECRGPAFNAARRHYQAVAV